MHSEGRATRGECKHERKSPGKSPRSGRSSAFSGVRVYPVAMTVGTGPLSIIFCWLYKSTGSSLPPPMPFHASFNATLSVLGRLDFTIGPARGRGARTRAVDRRGVRQHPFRTWRGVERQITTRIMGPPIGVRGCCRWQDPIQKAPWKSQASPRVLRPTSVAESTAKNV
jgi:hypothetical protein